MKKIFIIILCLTFIGNIKSQTNEQTSYVSELFEIFLSKSIQTNLDTKSLNNIYATNNHELYIINRKGFGNQIHKGSTKISKVNAITGTEEDYIISPSSKFIETGGNTNYLWIWSIAASDSLLFLAVDKEIWVYRFTNLMQYEYFKTIALESVYRLDIDGNNLHAFIDKDDGFEWYKINLSNYEVKKVRKLELKNHFFLQIAPVQILSIKNNALYFLQQNEPAIEKYSLTGKLLTTYSLEIPNWNKIPEEISGKLDSIKNITERNYAFPKYSIFDYNFMLLFYVFPSERFFMMAIDRNKSADAFATPYFIQIIGDTTIIEPFSVKLDENEKFGKKYFPFLTPRAEANIVYAHSNELVIQINRSTNVPWQNKTQKEFQHDENLYHRNNDAVTKMESYRFLKNYISIDSIQFLDYDDNFFSFNDVKKDKAIFIISQYPQCSTCIKTIWQFFSNKLMPDVELYSVTADCPTYLMKKEKLKEVSTYLKTENTPLFIVPKQFNSVTKRLLIQKTNPIVLLFDKKRQHIEVISANNIIADFMGNLTPSFIHTINNFIGK